MTEVPKQYFMTIKERNGNQLRYYDSLLQVTVRLHGTIFNLDTNPISEVDMLENIDQL